MRFVDTNVLVYAVSPASEDVDKRGKAQDLLASGGLALSAQVLQEFYTQVTRPSRDDPLTIRQWVVMRCIRKTLTPNKTMAV